MLSDFIAWFQDLLTNEPSPQEKLERAQRECRNKLQEIKQAIADVTTQKKKLQFQEERLQKEIERQEQEAQENVNKGNESTAKDILKHKKRNKDRLEDLHSQISKMDQIQTNLTEQKNAIERELRDIRTTRSNMKARKKAAEAEVMASEAFSDIDGVDIDGTMQDLQRQTDRLEARAEVARNTSKDPLEEELDTVDEEIEKELEEMKN